MARSVGRRRRGDTLSPLVDLADVFADDELVDRLADRSQRRLWPASPPPAGSMSTAAPPRLVGAAHSGRRPVSLGRHSAPAVPGDPLFELLGDWQDELTAWPLPEPVAPVRAEAAVAAGRGGDRRRSLRATLSIGVAIVALLVGSATIGSRQAQPGDALWPLASVLWTDRLESVESVHAVRLALAEARTALEAGRSRDAQLALLRAAVELGQVAEIDGRETMQRDVAALWVEATPPDPVGASTDESTWSDAQAWASPASPATSAAEQSSAAAAALAAAILAAPSEMGPAVAATSPVVTLWDAIATSTPNPAGGAPVAPGGIDPDPTPALPGSDAPTDPSGPGPSAGPVAPVDDPPPSVVTPAPTVPVEPTTPAAPADPAAPDPTGPPPVDPSDPATSPDPATIPDDPPPVPAEPPADGEPPPTAPTTEQSAPTPPPAGNESDTEPGPAPDDPGAGDADPADGPKSTDGDTTDGTGDQGDPQPDPGAGG